MQKIKSENIFLRSVIDEVPRLLGQLNRNPSSDTYGSFDRAFWHYRTNDISSARYQEAIFTLALLYRTPFEGNHYFQDEKILEWILAAFDFSCSIQNSDGSFDEWYVHEGSFVATAFVVAALSRTLEVMGSEKIPAYAAIVEKLQRAADWIQQQDEYLVLNQVAGSAVALWGVFRLTQNSIYREAAQKKIQFIIDHQSSEGWWSEYGGPDIGYLSLMVDYLSTYHQETGDERVRGALKKANRFILHFLHPNFTVGGEYLSRNTEYLIPSGFARLAATDESAKTILAFSAVALERKQGVYPRALDDRYLCYILYNWLEAGLMVEAGNHRDVAEAHFRERAWDVFFSDAGIRVIQDKNFYFVANLRKGGAFRIYSRNGLYMDSGIEVRYRGRAYSSGTLDHRNVIRQDTRHMNVSGFLKPIQEPLMRTFTMIVFKTFQILTGKISGIQKIMKMRLRKSMITYSNKTPLSFERSFNIFSDRIEITDAVDSCISSDHIHYGTKSSYIFIPSSKYFTQQELSRYLLKPSEERRARQDGKNIFIRIFHLNQPL